VPKIISESSLPSAAIMEELLADASSNRRRDTLNRLKWACDTVEVNKNTYKLSDIQRVLEGEHGKDIGPKAQSISNERNRNLGMYHYVEARLRELEVKPSIRNLRPHSNEQRITTTIDRIEDLDTRSAMLDLQDRLIVAQKGLERAKTLFKALRPGVDPESLINGIGFSPTKSSSIPADNIAALRQLLSILTDDEKLGTVGLSFDGRRVRRRGGTRDELVPPAVILAVQELLVHMSSES
jgi:hypothetical protein